MPPRTKLMTAVTIRFSEEDADRLRALADSYRMDVSDYVRHLVSEDLERAREQFAALSRIFARNGIDGQANND